MYIIIASLFYTAAFLPSLFSLSFFFLPLFLFLFILLKGEKTRRRILFLCLLYITFSNALTKTDVRFSLEPSSVREIYFSALYDQNVREKRKSGTDASLIAVKDEEGTISSAEGKIYVISPLGEVMKGDVFCSSGSFYGENIFIAENIRRVEKNNGAEFRKKAISYIRKALKGAGEDERELALMLLLGTSDGAEGSLMLLSREKGLMHIYALSGMHLVIISSFMLPVLNFFFKEKRKSEKTLLLPLLVFTYTASWRPSIMRAFIKYCSDVFLPEMDKSERFILVIIIHNALDPGSIISASAVLSYLALSGMAFLYASLTSLFKRVFSYPFSSIVISISAVLFTSFYSFHLFSSYSLSGIIYTPLISPLVTLYMFISILSILLPSLSFLLSCLYNLIHMLSSSPFLSFSFENITPLLILLFITFLLYAISIAKMKDKR